MLVNVGKRTGRKRLGGVGLVRQVERPGEIDTQLRVPMHCLRLQLQQLPAT